MSRAARRHVTTISLFPFLAVLICIMGSLVILLVLMVARVGAGAKTAASAAQAATTESGDDRFHREELEDARWRQELLQKQREETQQQLAARREELAYLEQHTAQLQDKAAELMARARQIDEGKRLRDDELVASQSDLNRLREEISSKKTEIDQARRKLQGQNQWYALIPYDGPNGTRRRPIYIECTDRGIVLQPEGIVFRPEDFSGPMDPGNPLDAALRAIREHMQQAGGKLGEAYPLLVVRPSGVVAYGAARSALKTWDDEFGYELIADDKKLDFGQPDPVLVANLQRTVEQARHRQIALAAAMPRRFVDEEPLTSFDPSTVPSLASTQPVSPGGRGVGAGRGGTGRGGSAGGGTGMGVMPSSDGPVLGSPNGGNGPGGSVPSSGAPGYAAGSGPYAYPSTSTPGGSTGGKGGGGRGAAANGGSTPGTTGGAFGPGGVQGGAPGAGQGTYGGQGNAGGQGAGTASSAGGAPPAGATQLNGVPGASSLAGGSSSPGAGRAGSGVVSGKSRGNNWGLPGAAGRVTGITRSVRVAVLYDRLVIIPEDGDDGRGRQVRISPQLQQPEVDAFVAGVQAEVKGWGLAVESGFWKPVLKVEVATDAEQQFADLQTALQGSGFELQRKAP